MKLSIAILDALADDFEGIEQIEKYLFFLGYRIRIKKIEKVGQKLLDCELMYINRELSDDTHTWYGMAEKGRALWLQSD